MERALYITKFRNVGLQKAQRLVLNGFSDKSEIGNLVILVGPNNSGKSNILDALELFGNNGMSRRDVSTLLYDGNVNPQLSLCCKNGINDNSEYTCRYTFGESQPQIIYPSFTDNDGDAEKLNKWISALTDLEKSINKEAARYGGGSISQLSGLAAEMEEALKSNPIAIEYYEAKVQDEIIDVISYTNRNRCYKNGWQSFLALDKHADFVRRFASSANDCFKEINLTFDKAFGMRFMPKIIRYKDEPIANSNLVTNKNNLSSNVFFARVFSAIEYPIDSILRTYEQFAHDQNRAALTKQEKIINSKLKKISRDFNRLYCKGTTQYNFEMVLESTNIYFCIFDGENACSLDVQSTGFKWFFNLYFNLLSGTTFNIGDIILMDEPATSLHVKGQRELRGFLKQFAVANGITVVIATHSPFLVDIDNLDELRVVEVRDGEAFIHNDFSAINMDDADSLLPVKEALTVESCHLYDPARTVVFVEGITDYNYLLAMKQRLGIKQDIIFLPIHGVGAGKDGKLKDKQLQISKRLIELRKNNPILLVDGDGAGKSMKDVNVQSELKVVMLSDIDEKFKTIESLFDPNDLNKFGMLGKNGNIKHASTSAKLKTFPEKYTPSEQTLRSFKKFFDSLIAETE